MKTIYRVAVPVDDQWHWISLRGPILHVASRDQAIVEVWFMHDTAAEVQERRVRVFGTGQDGVEGEHLGTAITPGGGLVWHLMERV